MRIRLCVPTQLLLQWYELYGTDVQKSFAAEDFKGEKVELSIACLENQAVLVVEGKFKARKTETHVNVTNIVDQQMPSVDTKSESCVENSHSYETHHPQHRVEKQGHDTGEELPESIEYEEIPPVERLHATASREPCHDLNFVSGEAAAVQKAERSALDQSGESETELGSSYSQQSIGDVLCGVEHNSMNNLRENLEKSAVSETRGTEQQYQCSVCGVCFKHKQLTLFRRHIRAKHRNNKTALQDAEQQKQRLLKKNAVKNKKDTKPKKDPSEKLAKCIFCQQMFRHVNDHKTICRENPNRTVYFYCPCGFRSCDSFLTDKHKKSCKRKSSDICCEMCGKIFQTRGGLSTHRRKIHQVVAFQSRPLVVHKCQTCGKEYFLKSRLKRHENRHSDDRAHVCETCGKTFKQRSHLRRHIDTQHKNKYSYRCHLCGHGMEKRHVFLKHKCGRIRRQQHEKPMPNNKPEMADMPVSTQERSSHPSDTVLCEENKWPRYATDNLKIYTCEVCGKGFKKLYHLRVHTNTLHNDIYKYRCDKCGHGVQKKQFLLTHRCNRVRRKQHLNQNGLSEEQTQGDTLPVEQVGKYKELENSRHIREQNVSTKECSLAGENGGGVAHVTAELSELCSSKSPVNDPGTGSPEIFKLSSDNMQLSRLPGNTAATILLQSEHRQSNVRIYSVVRLNDPGDKK